VPAIELDADMVGAAGFEHESVVERVSEFLETRVHATRR
jgi:hypothetical protein